MTLECVKGIGNFWFVDRDKISFAGLYEDELNGSTQDIINIVISKTSVKTLFFM